jgi:hypothetical protein
VVDVVRGYNIGFTIRDAVKMQAHPDELAKEGITPPSVETPPILFPISPWARLTGDECVVQTPNTSGEVEIFILDTEDGLYVGVGSDHTDRKLEATDIPWSKQVARISSHRSCGDGRMWPITGMSTLDSWVVKDRARTHYQHASVAEFWTPAEMVESVRGGVPDVRPRVFVSGTVVSLDHELIYGDSWEILRSDRSLAGRSVTATSSPVLAREIDS